MADHSVITIPSATQLRRRKLLEDVNDNSSMVSCFTADINRERLARMVKEQNLESFSEFGGIQRIAKALGTDTEKGISADPGDLRRRRVLFGSNTYFRQGRRQPLKGFFSFFVISDFVMASCLVVNVLSYLVIFTVMEIKETILVFLAAALIVLLLWKFYRWKTKNFCRAKELEKLLNESDEIQVNVVRDGRHQQIRILDVVVGDVVVLNEGDQIPADGLLLQGCSCPLESISSVGELNHPFMFFDCKDYHGLCHMLVTSVGVESKWGERMNSFSREFHNLTPSIYVLDRILFLLKRLTGILKGFFRKKQNNCDNRLFFGINQESLTKLLKEKNLDSLYQLGGVEGITEALKSDVDRGINGDAGDLHSRISTFGSNTDLKFRQPHDSFKRYLLKALLDSNFLNFLSTIVVYLTLRIKKDGWRTKGWFAALCFSTFAIFIDFAIAKATRRMQSSYKLEKLSNIQVSVVRDGQKKRISNLDIVVGDVIYLRAGDFIPADGLFLKGDHLLQVENECSMNAVDTQMPFLFTGSKVTCGSAASAYMLVTSVGKNTSWAEMIMSSLNFYSEKYKPLQTQIEKLMSYREKIALVNLLIPAVLLGRCLIGKQLDDDNGNFVTLLVAVFIFVVKTVAWNLGILYYETLSSWNWGVNDVFSNGSKFLNHMTAGRVSTIITDEKSMLMETQMKVAEFHLHEETMLIKGFSGTPEIILEALRCGVALNTQPEFSGCPVEKALLSWGVLELGIDMEEMERTQCVLSVSFNSEKKLSGSLIRKRGDSEKTAYMHWKGDAELVLPNCQNYYDNDGTMKPLDPDKRVKIKQVIEGMRANGLICMGLAHKQIIEEEKEGTEEVKGQGGEEEGTQGEIEEVKDGGKEGEIEEIQGEVVIKEEFKLEEDGLTLLGIIGLCLPEEVKRAVESCQDIGVKIKMVSENEISQAKAIAIGCGILAPNQDEDGVLVMEAEALRNCSNEEERLEMVDRIFVMPRSTPSDKLDMVKWLKESGEVVLVTGTSTSDVDVVKEADLGFSMETGSTEAVKESSDFIILNNNFAAIANTLRLGRCFNNFVLKLSVIYHSGQIVAFVMNFIVAVELGGTTLPEFDLLIFNFGLPMVVFALFDAPLTEEEMKKTSVGRSVWEVTRIIWGTVMAQVLFRVVSLLILFYKGKAFFGVDKGVKDTMIYTTLYLSQLFNIFYETVPEKMNVFEGNLSFPCWLSLGVLSFPSLEVSHWSQWIACTGIAAMSLLVTWAVKFIPFDKLLDMVQHYYSRIVFWRKSEHGQNPPSPTIEPPVMESTSLPGGQ